MQVVWTNWTVCGAGESKDPRNLAKLGTLGALLSSTEGARCPYLTVTAVLQNSNWCDRRIQEALGLRLQPINFCSCSTFALNGISALRQWQGDLQLFESRCREKRRIIGWYAWAGLGEFHPDLFGETTGHRANQKGKRKPSR